MLFPIVLNELDDLEKIRKQLIEENIQDNFLFTREGRKIAQKYEKKWTLKKIVIIRDEESCIDLITNDIKQNLEENSKPTSSFEKKNVEKNFEENKIVEDIYKSNEVNDLYKDTLNGKNNENKIRNEKIKTEISKRSRLIEKKGDLDIYLYPKIELKEKKN